MFYNEMIERFAKEEKNPVNRMYINELVIKWKKTEAIFNKSNTADLKNPNDRISYFNELASSMTDYLNELSNPKYNFTKNSKKGFKKDSDIFRPEYVADILSIMVKDSGVLDINGTTWGNQKYTIKQKFIPDKICQIANLKEFPQEQSQENLCIVHDLEIQFRSKGKRNYSKYNISLPILIFNVFNTIEEEDFILLDYYAKQAKSVYPQSKSMLILEQLPYFRNKPVSPTTLLEGSNIDSMFVLFESRKSSRITGKVLNDIYEKIMNYLC